MKIVHIESGLGNQMLSYCEYLALQKANPNDKCYIETIVFDIPECNDIICQWNGYELKKIFGINAPNIKDVVPPQKWEIIISLVRKSQFWNKKWNYPRYITQAFNQVSYNIENIRGDFEQNQPTKIKEIINDVRDYFTHSTWLGCTLKRFIPGRSINHESVLFPICNNDVFTGQRLLFSHINSGIERISGEIKKNFVFPQFNNKKNLEFSAFLSSINSVFIHARRGDMLGRNGWCYKYGYFRRATSYIKKHVEKPVFVFFTDPGSIEWCKKNLLLFGLDSKKDKIYFVDWNSGDQSFRDMQLMSYCKHGIITNSSFGWWGSYFITNPNKITISPLKEINTTHHF